MLKGIFSKKSVMILLVLIIFLSIPHAFALDSFYQNESSGIVQSDDVAGSIGDIQSDDLKSIDDIQSDDLKSIEDIQSDDLKSIDDSAKGFNSIDESNNLESIDESANVLESGNDKSILEESNTIYVKANGGSDLAGRGSYTNPYQTLSRAMDDANDGDAIYFFNGTYSYNSFVINKNVTLFGQSQERTIFTGNGNHGIIIVNATDVSFINLSFRDGYADDSQRIGGAIKSTVGGNLNVINCSFTDNRASTHGGAIGIQITTSTPEEKRMDLHLNVRNSSFLNNEVISLYGGAIFAANNGKYNNYVNIESSVFIDNFGGSNQEHTIAASSSYNSTYLDIHDSIIIADSSRVIDSYGDYKTLVYFHQHGTNGFGYANANGNWWGDNSNPNEFNRTNFDIGNWIVMNASISKSFVVATLDTLKHANGTYSSFDSSKLPNRLAIFSPSQFFQESEIDLIEGVAKNEFIGVPPQDIQLQVDNQKMNLTINAIDDKFWFIGDKSYSTLSEAIQDAESGDIIKGIPDIYTPDIIGSEISIDKNLTISKLEGYKGDYILILSNNSRIFNVLEGACLKLGNLIFESINDGTDLDYDGGLIYINAGASVEIESSIFRKNQKSNNGGAIYSNGNLSISNSQFENLKSSQNGGAIYSAGNLTVLNSSFNSIFSASNGGAIYSIGEKLNISHSNFTGNRGNDAGAIYSISQINSIFKSIFMENYASNNYDVIYLDSNKINNDLSSEFIANYCIFANENENDVTDVFIDNKNNLDNLNLNLNYWGFNSLIFDSASDSLSPEGSSNIKANLDLDNWVILSLAIDSDLSLISVNTVHNVYLAFNEYTDGESNFSLEDFMPDFGFNLNVIAGEINPQSVSFNQSSNNLTLTYSAPSKLSDEVISIDKYSDQNLSFFVRTPVFYYWYIGDNAYETLEEAIAAAENNDIIEGVKFNHLYESTISIDKNITIKSRDPLARAVFNAQNLNSQPILHIADGAIVNLIDLSFTNVNSDYAGAILNDGNLTISNGIFNRNSAEYGGAIYNNGNLNIVNSTFTYNTASFGGAIFNNGTLNISSSNFFNNSALNSLESSNAFGGAIYNGNQLAARSSRFSDNKAKNGGAIYSYNENKNEQLMVEYSVFDTNDADIGKAISVQNAIIRNNFYARLNCTDLIYNISEEDYIIPQEDFTYSISGDSDIGFGERAQFTVKLESNGGDPSKLPSYNISVSNMLSNGIDLSIININQGTVILTYIANQEIGEDSIELNSLSGLICQYGFNVSPLNTSMVFENISSYYNDADSFIVYLKDANGNILADRDLEIIFDNSTYHYVTDSYGKVILDITGLEVGMHEGNISFKGETKYKASNASFHIEIQLIPTGILANNMSVYYDNEESLEIALEDGKNNPLSNRKLSVHIFNDEVSYALESYTDELGKISIPIMDNPEDSIRYLPGNYTVNISFAGDVHYGNSSKFIALEVKRMPASIVGNDLTVYYNTSASLELLLNDLREKPLSDMALSIMIADGSGKIIIEENLSTNQQGKVLKEIKLDMGAYKLNVIYGGNELYEGTQKIFDMNVVRMPSHIDFNTLILHSHEEANLLAYLRDANNLAIANNQIHFVIFANGNENEKIYDLNLSTDLQGRISKLISLDKGIYNLSLKYAGDDFHDGSSLDLTLNVLDSDKPYIEASDIVSNEKSVEILAYLKDKDGNPIPNEILYFDFGGEILANTTDFQGKAALNVNLNRGNYSVLLSYEDENHNMIEKTVLVEIDSDEGNGGGNGSDNGSNGGSNNGSNNSNSSNGPSSNSNRIKTSIAYNTMSTFTVNTKIDGKSGKYFTVTLKDENGNALVNKALQFGFNGKIYNVKTDSNGIAKLQINLKYKGTYTIAVSFLGDNDYYSSVIVSKVKVKPQKLKLKTKKKAYKAGKKLKKLTATLKNKKGKAIKGKKIVFTVNKKKYTAKTNRKGIAVVKVRLQTRKTYRFTARFAGDKTYKAVKATGSVKIK